MKKFLLFVLGGLVLIVAVAFLSVNFIVKGAVEKVGSRYLGVPVTLASANISLISGHGTLNGLEIANPAEFGDGPALSLDEISVRLELESLFSDQVRIEDVHIQSPQIHYIGQGTGSNLQVLKNNLAANSRGNGSGDTSGNTPAQRGEPTRVTIDLLTITEARMDATHGTVNAVLDTVEGQEMHRTAYVELPKVIIRDIGKGGGTGWGQAAEKVFDQVVEVAEANARKAAREELGRAIKERAGKTGTQVMDAIEGLF